jgi:hypothetical protein
VTLRPVLTNGLPLHLDDGYCTPGVIGRGAPA